ncbi:hypothetical protein PAEPH01_0529 [Pancytospora epiphaga]|nr:hypothetical protein PAEPH01_0529 [Pancytospora epiphaga]
MNIIRSKNLFNSAFIATPRTTITETSTTEIIKFDQIHMKELLAFSSSLILPFLFLLLLIGIYILWRTQRRMESIRDLPRVIRNYTFKGIVTSVGDGDGFKLFHVPCLRSCSYNRTSPKLPIRLAGIDAPETRAFNTPAQPFSKEAKEYLRELVLGKMVRVTVLSIDFYGRIVAIVHIKTGWLFWDNVNLLMLQAGMACVYDRGGAEYGSYKSKFEEAERKAKKKKIGMWSQKKVVLPMDHKSKHK